jgi:GNAT superfamily N-acetyltransferase
MSNLSIRLATLSDVDDLVEMRLEFKLEDGNAGATAIRPGYESDCRTFLASAISRGDWEVWVAEVEGYIVSHAFVALIDKVANPNTENSRISYLTNVYTRPAHRGQGVGIQLVNRAQQAAREANVELMIVWPSDESVSFYKRQGFNSAHGPMIWESRGPMSASETECHSRGFHTQDAN